MDVREKLVKLIENGVPCPDGRDPFGEYCDTCRYSESADCSNERLADYLISHDVTVQERGYWVSLTDCANAGVYCSVCNKKVYKEDYTWCNRKNKLRSDYCPHCGSKMMPHPPKGE